MTDTTTSTRQRLLDLWEKCPECRPDSITWAHDDVFLLHGRQLGHTAVAFDLACIAMVRWLLTHGLVQICGGPGKSCPDDNPYAVEPYDYDDDLVGNFVAATFTDALISAVEAVMEKKDDKPLGNNNLAGQEAINEQEDDRNN